MNTNQVDIGECTHLLIASLVLIRVASLVGLAGTLEVDRTGEVCDAYGMKR